MEHKFSGNNDDSYTGSGKIWEIAARYNKESREHIFDRFGDKLTEEVSDAFGQKEIVNKLSGRDMRAKQCLKHKTLNVSRRKVSRDEYEPVSLR